ncbi:MAG: NifB/NifX family molybdenum-iron cluster-binding protein [Candidatus Tectomicrobia bacterium]|uniref:NifB/NifX family molybdenum-iron cluster-binding protein n=1 Tax=Tectimicrobiota bacterium TaxID=2528274 RepID=A0A933GL89_UNCTE|nr:NifB/NifX family molybdenum-iron cluster-binding protein [Candidatus Tectomicrobia bacterium]
MKRIALACGDGFGIAGVLSPYFANSPYFTFVNIKEDQIVGFEVLENPYRLRNQNGSIPRFIASRKADVMIAREMDPKALNGFKQLGIDVLMGVEGKVLDIIEAYLKEDILVKTRVPAAMD